jgi:hypothetical protein
VRPDDDDLIENIRDHIAPGKKGRPAGGDEPEAARHAAARGKWTPRWLEILRALWGDILFARRSLMRAKGLTSLSC